MFKIMKTIPGIARNYLPGNRITDFFINPGISRIAVIEVAVIEDPLYKKNE